MLTSSRPNRISTKSAVISLLILTMVVAGLLLPVHQPVKAADGLPTLTCRPEGIEIFNDSGSEISAHTYKVTYNGSTMITAPLNLANLGIFTFYFPYGQYGTYNFQAIKPDGFTVLTQISCIQAEPTRTPTETHTPTPQPLFTLDARFDGSGNAVFTIHNYGDSMIIKNTYILYESGSIVEQADFYLIYGGDIIITVAGDPGNYLLNIIDQNGVTVKTTTLNNKPATPTFTSTATSTSTSTSTSTATHTSTTTSTSTPTSTATRTPTVTSTTTFTPTVTVTSTITFTPTINQYRSNPPTQTPTPKPWFWFFKKPTATSAVVLTPLLTQPMTASSITVILKPALMPSATPTPAPVTVEPSGIPLTALITGGLLLLGFAGFGIFTLSKK